MAPAVKPAAAKPGPKPAAAGKAAAAKKAAQPKRAARAKKAAPRERATVATLRRPPAPWRKSLLQIPSIGVDAPVTRARGNWKWIKGPAYDPKSPGPGGAGNAIIAAHRNMWARTFEKLPRVQPGDRIYVRTKDHRYTYVVQWSRKVSTRETGVLANTKDPCITLYTCVLPYRNNERWAVRGRLVAVQAAAPGSSRLASSR